ncbi:hypothetical protein J8F10_25750 [Gemmata sp. G18]|uniref:General stress protein 17M-like domain-containing protein n=1 Tax=Gemmata palustris TaxID=2822762 RepID=A0ABS5BY52_9BACT|nr:general stress protein [Gemmata palustris]MBP3958666.1 hypothetical protein [Gemmata palustris]
MKKATANAVVGVFYTRSEAESAIRDLRAAGFADDSIGMIARDAEGNMVNERNNETLAGEGAAAGAVVGAGAGALVGLGVLAGTIPVIGPVLAIGTLGTVLLNAAGGAAILGLVGALIGVGIPEDDARYYESEVHGGRFLVTVEAGNRQAEAWTTLHRAGGYNRTTPALNASV